MNYVTKKGNKVQVAEPYEIEDIELSKSDTVELIISKEDIARFAVEDPAGNISPDEFEKMINEDATGK